MGAADARARVPTWSSSPRTPVPTPSSSYGDALPYPENASTLVAEQVPGIDAILVGHAHLEIAERFVTNTVTGKQVAADRAAEVGHAAVA